MGENQVTSTYKDNSDHSEQENGSALPYRLCRLHCSKLCLSRTLFSMISCNLGLAGGTLGLFSCGECLGDICLLLLQIKKTVELILSENTSY